MEILTFIGGVMLSIIGYFLRNTMKELQECKRVTYKIETEVKVLQNDYANKVVHLNEKMDTLADSIKELNDNLKELNKKIK